MVINANTLRQAAEIQEQIDALTTQRDQLLGGLEVTQTPRVSKGGVTQRHFSPDAIERIRAAQRRRWKNARKTAAAAQAIVAAAAAGEPIPVAATLVAPSSAHESSGKVGKLAAA